MTKKRKGGPDKRRRKPNSNRPRRKLGKKRDGVDDGKEKVGSPGEDAVVSVELSKVELINRSLELARVALGDDLIERVRIAYGLEIVGLPDQLFADGYTLEELNEYINLTAEFDKIAEDFDQLAKDFVANLPEDLVAKLAIGAKKTTVAIKSFKQLSLEQFEFIKELSIEFSLLNNLLVKLFYEFGISDEGKRLISVLLLRKAYQYLCLRIVNEFDVSCKALANYLSLFGLSKKLKLQEFLKRLQAIRRLAEEIVPDDEEFVGAVLFKKLKDNISFRESDIREYKINNLTEKDRGVRIVIDARGGGEINVLLMMTIAHDQFVGTKAASIGLNILMSNGEIALRGSVISLSEFMEPGKYAALKRTCYLLAMQHLLACGLIVVPIETQKLDDVVTPEAVVSEIEENVVEQVAPERKIIKRTAKEAKMMRKLGGRKSLRPEDFHDLTLDRIEGALGRCKIHRLAKQTSGSHIKFRGPNGLVKSIPQHGNVSPVIILGNLEIWGVSPVDLYLEI